MSTSIASFDSGGGYRPAPDVSIIVLTTTAGDRLDACLRSVRQFAASEAVEIILLGNGAPAGQLAALAARHGVRLITSTVNHGFAGGCNWAARDARGRRLAFLNDDAVVSPGWLTGLTKALDDDERAAVAGSRVLLDSDRLQEAGSVLWRDGTSWGIGRYLNPELPEFLVRRQVDYVSFCSAMVRRDVWEAIGGFDERFFPAYYEDADLCLRARSLGWRVLVAPDSRVVHEEGASTDPRYRTFIAARNRARFVEKWQGLLDDYDPRPVDAGSRSMTRLALATLRRRVATDDLEQPRWPGPSSHLTQDPQVPAELTEALIRENRHLQADRNIKQEYIAELSALLSDYSLRTLVGVRARKLRGWLGRRVRSHRRLAALAKPFRAR